MNRHDQMLARAAQAEERLDAHERVLEDSVPAVLGVLTRHMARRGLIDPRDLGAAIRESFNEGLRHEDATGLLLSKFADEIDKIDVDADRDRDLAERKRD